MSATVAGVQASRGGQGRPVSGVTGSVRRFPAHASRSNEASQPEAGPSRTTAPHAARQLRHDDPVRAAQDEATRVWKDDMRRLLEHAEQRFADVCWTSAGSDTLGRHDLDSELGHSAFTHSEAASHDGLDAAPHHVLIPPPPSLIPTSPATSETLIWAHKAILYARAPNTFQTRFLNLRSPAAQLQHIGSTASLVSLPLRPSESQLSLALSNFSSSTQTGATSTTNANGAGPLPGIPAKPRRSIRGAAPPSSFSMTKPSLRKPISRSSISRPLRKGSADQANSIASGFATSDSEGEGGPASSLRASRLINAGPSPAANPSAKLTSPSKVSQISSSGSGSAAPGRKASFASVASTTDSHITDTRSTVSDAGTVRAPISLKGVSPAFFEATLQCLYTGEEAMVDAFEFLFEDRLASDLEVTPEEKLDKLRSDLTFMWRSKLFSDVKLVLGDDDDDDDDDSHDGVGATGMSNGRHRRGAQTRMMDIPDANMSVLSLAQTMDTDRIEESDGEEDELTSFSTHRMILASRSEYFASLLLSPYADSRAPVLHLPSPPFTPASLHFTLGFLYTGTLFFSNRTFDLSTAFSLWRAGAYLQIETLQALVVALIDREFCHGFACSPPCRKCVKRVPRTLAFATSPDVSEQTLREPALAAVSGSHFGMYWGKDVGNLDPMLQDRIVDSISESLARDPTLVVSVLRQLSIVGQRIDTERSSRWVEALRLMAETVENRVMPVLHADLDKIVQSAAWSDLLDGVGSLGDVLEKCLVMLIDGLTEARAAQIYQTLVGQVLLREQGFEVAQSRQAVETARASLLRYLKKRWINVRALAGFNKLEKWCLKELADELEVTTTDLYLPEVPPSVKSATMPGRLMAARRTSSLGGSAAASAAARASAGTAPQRSSIAHRSSLGGAADSSRSRGTSAATTATSPVGRQASPARKVLGEDGEREAGPIHMRAAVLNRNAAKTSVINGHRSLSAASTSSVPSPTTRSSPGSPHGAVSPSTVTTTKPKRTMAAAASASATSTSAKPAAAASPATTKAGGIDGSTARPALPTAPASSRQQQPRTRTASGTSVASIASTRSTRPTPTTAAAAAAAASPRIATRSVSSSPSASDQAVTPTRATPGPSADTDKTPTKPVRAVRSATALPRPAGTTRPKPSAATSVDSAAATTKTAQPRALGHKSSFLRATPLPGGTFSLSSTDSGADLRARTISSASSARKETASRARSVTPTKSSGRNSSMSSQSSTGSSVEREATARTVVEAMPANAVEKVARAKAHVSRSESSSTIVYHPEPGDADDERDATQLQGGNDELDEQRSEEMPVVGVEGGVSLRVGIACIVSLPVGSSVAGSAAGRASPTAGRGKTTVQPRRSVPAPTLPAKPSGAKRPALSPAASTSRSPSTSRPPSSVVRAVSATTAGATARGTAAALPTGRKFRADVRYIGPVAGTAGAWIGIAVRLSSAMASALPIAPAATSASGSSGGGVHTDVGGGAGRQQRQRLLRLHDGQLDGVRYFHCSSGEDDCERRGERYDAGRRTQEAPHRRARRKDVWHAVSPHLAFPAADVSPSSTTTDAANTERVQGRIQQKGLEAYRESGVAQQQQPEEEEEGEEGTTTLCHLFVRPEAVVWVVQ